LVKEVPSPNTSTLKSPISENRRAVMNNVTNLDIGKVSNRTNNLPSKPMDESAKHEYSPVIPNGITSLRYEEMKNPPREFSLK